MVDITTFNHQDLANSSAQFRARPALRVSAAHFAVDLFWYALWFGVYWMLRGYWIHAWQILAIAYPVIFVRWLWRSVLHFRCIQYEIDGDRVHFAQGILTKLTSSIEVFRIHNVTMRQGILERLLGIGTVIIESHSPQWPVVEMFAMEHPEQLRRWLSDYVMRYRQAHSMNPIVL